MHEMSIAQQIVKIALASVPDDSTWDRISCVNLTVGKLTAIGTDSLRFCYEVVTKNTVLGGSRLHITEIPVRAHCSGCGNAWTVEEPDFTCPKCRGGNVELLSGRELHIESIELSEEDD